MNYGPAKYIEDDRVVEGDVILDESRLYISSDNISSSTYIPLDKIILIRKRINGFEVKAKLSPINSIFVKILMPLRKKNRLINDIVNKQKMKKKFFKAEWVAQASWR
jgi:hypothetical protein